MDPEFASNAFPLILFAVIASFFLIPALGAAYTALRNKTMLDNQVPLPDGCKWGVFDNEIRLMVDLNHGTGDKREWRNGLVALSHYNVNRHSHRFPAEFVDTSKKGTLNMARWMREQYINTDGFTTPIPFPVEGGSWDIEHKHGSRVTKVNGLLIDSTGFNDHRDVITAMVHAYPMIVKEEQKRVEQERSNRSIQRILKGDKPALTTRETKDISMDSTKKQYLS